jgi:ligand-binding SRPBCC domain-containing protein
MPTGEHVLRTETHVPRRRAEVFAFFADAGNLEQITPPELRFQIQTPMPVHMAPGTIIEYQLRLFGIPFSWTTLISRWEEDTVFVDEQVKGPYAMWIHSHTFRDSGEGTRVTDEVRYRLPFFPVGEIASPLVGRQLRRIFAYRAERLKSLLGAGSPPSA